MLQRDFRWFAAAATLMLALAGCGSAAGLTGNWPISSDGFPPIGSTTSVSGTVTIPANGCVMLDTGTGSAPLWVVWPAGATYVAIDEHTNQIRLAGGAVVSAGDRVEIVGELMSRSGLPDGGISDSMWGAHAGFCLGREGRYAEILRAETVSVS
jgi:hypothetical protein